MRLYPRYFSAFCNGSLLRGNLNIIWIELIDELLNSSDGVGDDPYFLSLSARNLANTLNICWVVWDSNVK
ncbi:hypothetical protein [Paenibacillus xylanivorans]|uniref:hypothetical protein n=1 Tax=Paenibacillus xylanivorans TaxID=1705561 RepID=UPI00191C64AF|nr:hypothetical protein [Paenibacillus xylanivorans]